MPVLQCGFLANAPGEPGCSKDISSPLPVPVSSPVELARLHPGGWGFALASTSDGDLYAWGVNQASLLSKAGSADDGTDPGTLDKVAGGVAVAAAGFDHGAVVQQGQLSLFGPNIKGPAGTSGLYLAPVPLPDAVVQVAAGEHHTLVLTAAGNLYAFGSNREGQLGSASVKDASAEPLLVLGPAAGTAAITAVAAGARHSAAIDAPGQCLLWGWSLHGQCGTGAAVPSVPTPTALTALGPLKCVAIAAGMAHTLCCTDQGDVYAFGSNGDGQLGDGSRTASQQPKLVEHPALDAEEVVKVTAGARHSVALCRSGKAFSWGYGAFGQLGSGAHADALAPQEIVLPGGGKVADAVAGWWHTVLLVE